MRITRTQRRRARRIVALGLGDVLGALGGPVGMTPEGRKGGLGARVISTRRFQRMRDRFYVRVTEAQCEVVLWCYVESLVQLRTTGAYRNVSAVVADMRDDAGELAELTAPLRMLAQHLTPASDARAVRTVAAGLLDAEVAAVWKRALWADLGWERAFQRALRERDEPTWGLLVGLARAGAPGDLRELLEVAHAIRDADVQLGRELTAH